MKPVVLVALAACGSSRATNPDIDAPPDQPIDARPDAVPDKSGPCVGNFGNSAVDGYSRFDGTLVAVLAPGNTTCPKPNSTHMILEIRVNGDVYRMVAAMQSETGNPMMAFAERDGALTGPAWQDGQHLGVAMDYVATHNLHRLDFTPMDMPTLTDAVTARVTLGAHISVYATVENANDSAHLIHRNQTNQDGAIVIDPETSPHYLMFRFDNQLF